MNKLTKKDIIILIIATITIIVAGIFIWRMLFPPKTKITNNSKASQDQMVITTEIDQDTYKKIESLADYGQSDLNGIGKGDLFADGASGYVDITQIPPKTTPTASATTESAPAE